MRALAITALVLLHVSTAWAEVRGDKNAAKPHVVAGDTAYKLGKFDDALASYAKAYELYPAPALLFNLGQCHRNLKNFERAVFFYEGFLRESPANAPNRKLVEELLKETRFEVERALAAKKAADEAARIAAEKAAEDARKAEEAAKLEAARIKAINDAKIEAEKAAAQREAERLAREEAARRDREAFEAKKLREERERERRERPMYKKWWFWSAAVGVAAVASTAYYFSGDTTVIPPSGSLGGLDRR